MNSERELFEEAIKKISGGYVKNQINEETGEYLYGVMQVMWVVWQASAQREGYKLVPVDTLKECLEWSGVAMWDSPSEKRDIEITHHVEIIEAIIGDVDE